MSSSKGAPPDNEEVIRVCSAQISSVWEEPGQSLKKAEPFVRYAVNSGADLVCFPEQYATGWDPEAASHVQEINGPIISAYRELARTNSIAVLGSVREASFSRPRNTAVAIDKDGSIMTTYAKMHLFSPSHEDLYFSRGDAPGIFSIGGLTLGIAICYDLRFAGLFRMYAKRGVHVVIVHAAWPGERQKYWELFITSRAAENQMYVVGVNTVGKTPAGRYSGSSMTADPSGTIISRAGSAEELIFSDISPAIVRKTRRDFPMEHDHRDLLYHSLLP